MITKAKKIKIVEGLVDKFSRASGIYLIDYATLKVSEAIKLRRAFKNIGVDYKVAKNSLILRAMREANVVFPDESVFTGMTGVIFAYNDPVAPSKTLKEMITLLKKTEFKGALIEGEFYGADRLEEITKLPSKEDIIAAILASLSSPATGIVRSLDEPIRGVVGAIGATIRDLASVIEEVAKKKNAA